MNTLLTTMAIGVVALAIGGGWAAYQARGPAAVDRPDCPGQIRCPLSGELVCRDRCPLEAQGTAQSQFSCCR